MAAFLGLAGSGALVTVTVTPGGNRRRRRQSTKAPPAVPSTTIDKITMAQGKPPPDSELALEVESTSPLINSLAWSWLAGCCNCDWASDVDWDTALLPLADGCKALLEAVAGCKELPPCVLTSLPEVVLGPSELAASSA